jgi:type I restriction enzyme S subunit
LPVAGVLDLSPSNGRSVKDRTGGFPVLRLTALHENRVDLSQFKEGAWDRDDAINFLVAEDDFLLARGNGSIQLVGQGRLAPKPEREVAFPDTMIRVRIDPKIMRPKFFAALWNSRLVRRQIEASARTTAGIYKINQGHVNSFGLPLCSLAEQDAILAHLDRLLPCLDDAAQEVLRRLRDSWVLRQSILMRAFAGKLVEQDPNDELASVLLERIGAEKEAQAQKKRRGSTGKKANKGKAARKAEKRKDAA